MPLFAARTLAALLLIAGVPLGAALAAQTEYSPAQVALFGTPHLENLSGPAHLRYDLERSGSQEPPFEDTIEVIVTAVAEDGSKDLEFSFLNGERRRAFSKVEGFRGNPLVMLYLQWDVETMAQIVAGSNHYFRNRIRNALVDRAEVEDTTIELDGRSVAARRVRFRPFEDDPAAKAMGAFANKLYEFTLTPEVPGGIYRIHTLVPGAVGGDPVVEDVLTFREEIQP